MFDMKKIIFNNDYEVLTKLKEVQLMSKTKEISNLSEIIYKSIDDYGNVKKYNCKILGYNFKNTTDNSINKVYENLTIQVQNRIFDINIDYLKDMQKSSWNNKNFEQFICKNNLNSKGDIDMVIVHLNTGPRKGIILEIKNAKLTIPTSFLKTAITTGFNKATGLNLSSEEIMQKHFVNTYSDIKFCDDNETFNLEKNMTEFSLGHKKINYIFIEENLSVAEIDSKQYDRIVSIDFETANSKRASVCSIGFVVEEQESIIEEKEILVNPQTDFSSMNMRIHGIRPLDVEDAPTWYTAWKEVEEYITPSTLVIAHNLRNMELSCIRQECERYEMELPEFARVKGHNKMAYDTLKIAKDTLEDVANLKLNTLCEYFDIDLKHHNALSDARACLELFHHLRGDYVTTE